MLRVSILGGSGYAGGELIRLLLRHPLVQIASVTSESHAGEYVYRLHPNLRKLTALQFTTLDQLQPCEVLFAALPHGEAQKRIEQLAGLAPKVIDLSADFRLRDPKRYERWYGEPHAAVAWLDKFTYGLPELHRNELRSANFVSGVGCNATASIFALLPLQRAQLLDEGKPLIVDIKVGSSEGGNSPSLSSHHPERSGSVRSFAPTGHRHTAEVNQELGLRDVHLSVTSVELVRGVLATAHVWLKAGATEKDLWKAYRAVAKDEPFVRLVKDKTGIHRYPDPKIVAGSNFVDIGFEVEEGSGRAVSIAALDNLMKGAAGSAVQAMNVMCGFDECTGLDFAGLHPS
ncbi:MAG: N-acetyl-gamma-glutamyl-phosphate reductase [Chloroflexi bacterium]|nr:MAG: N-acetyl-gamma-glutamyl-phosphate reductase [Chloroflexota bacterium]